MVFKKCKSGHTKSCLCGEVIDDSNSFCKVLLWYYEVGMTSIFTILLTIYQSLDIIIYSRHQTTLRDNIQ